MTRPFYLTFSKPLPEGWRRRTYATQESAVRHAWELLDVFPRLGRAELWLRKPKGIPEHVYTIHPKGGDAQ